MGNNKEKRHKDRSRSRDKDDRRDKKKNKYRSSAESDEFETSDSSPERRKHRKRSRDRSRSRDRGHKHKSKKHRSRSRERLPTAEEVEREKEKTREQKELAKRLETPEEKRARRLAKKEAKGRRQKEQMGWDEEYMGYTNADNPFGDEQLLSTFVWDKKLEKEGLHNASKGDVEKLQKKKMMENKVELEKVKKRRLEREREREERERDREQEQRDKECEYYNEWEKQEDNFHLNQVKLRSKIRIDDGRAKPIDLLAKYISFEENELSIEMHEPYTYLNGLTIADLEDLLEDIKVYSDMEQCKNIDYWRDMSIVARAELDKLRKIDPDNADSVGERRSGINESVTDEVVAVFKGKTLSQLAQLEIKIRQKLSGGQEGVDVGYWESLLQQLRAHMAKMRLREKHQFQLTRKLFKLKEEQGIVETNRPLFPIAAGSSSETTTSTTEPSTSAPSMGPPAAASISSSEATPGGTGGLALAHSKPPQASGSTVDAGINEEKSQPSEDPDLQNYEDYTAGSYSPVLLTPDDLEADQIIYDPEDDIRRLEYARKRLVTAGRALEEGDTAFEKKAREGMNDDEAQFSVEVPVEKQALLWSDKYRPRKPRFFNRVHTGFEWNKYNQTHYDIDNPPPKIVQGYKFNIFYPDLIDKTETPEYSLTPNEDNPDFATIKFHAGAPYEDIAFKVVSREWEYSYKRGFRCQFHNNIFQLWYHFKRYRYRR